MRTDNPKAVHLSDYQPPDYVVERTELRLDLDEETTSVDSRLWLRRRPGAARNAPLVLDGQDLELVALRIDGRALARREYDAGAERLVIPRPGERFVLECTNRIHPRANTALEGLYTSGPMLCTQCEAQGFRRITWYPDRPDVMAPFSTLLIADRERNPVLLSNGNRIGGGELPGGRHWAQWHDPHPKPSYLFALVAGDLACREDRYVTGSGRAVALRFYTEPENIDQCDHAIDSLKRAMRWDEQTYGREYDLDIYMVVAVGHFNMGAMENKGLNIFNTSCVLARPDTATDQDFSRVEAVVGHEYFHNWTGNRVTCRDWFQLSLKEGLTVFREAQFSGDMTAPALRRISDVRVLRSNQFPEDAGPMAHPVRPASYIEISNFYTATVYEKGAEVIGMIHRLVGTAGFRRGMDLYFERHDGQAVTTDDFVRAMEDANGIDLRQFRLWYTQAGTPRVHVRPRYDARRRTYTLEMTQSCPPTPGQARKRPLHVPVLTGLLGPDGNALPLRMAGEARARGTERLLELRRRREVFEFVSVPDRPVPSLLRDFSAPVILELELDDSDLAFVLAHDTDPFNRWEAAQQLATRLLVAECRGAGPALHEAAAPFIAALGRALADTVLDPALIAETLTLPGETVIAEQMESVDPVAVHRAREALRTAIATQLAGEFEAVYARLNTGARYRYDPAECARRRLKNACLAYLACTGDESAAGRCQVQFDTADNMTDEFAGLWGLANMDHPGRDRALARFYDKWRHEALVVDKWFSVQASSRLPDTPARVRSLLEHPDFDLGNPNRVRALLGAFAHGNPAHFHAADGAGYAFVAAQVRRLDPVNPQVAARLALSLSRWRRYDPPRQRLMRRALQTLVAGKRPSRDLYEIVAKSLGRK